LAAGFTIETFSFHVIQGVQENVNSLKGFLGDFVEFEHNEGDNDFTEFHSIINSCHPFITLWNSVKTSIDNSIIITK